MKYLIIVFAFLSVAFVQPNKSKSKEIIVAAYNLRMDTSSDGVNAWPNRKEEVKALIQYHEFDIIGTQEGFKHQLDDLLEMPSFAYVGGGRDDGKDGGEHSAILYRKDRFQVLDSGDFWLRENPEEPGLGWDATCCNRIASWAKFKDKNSRKQFYVFNVHFDHQGVVARRESAKLMEQKIKEIAKNAPVILTGDFNSTPETEQMVLLSSFLNDAYGISKTPPYGPVGTFNSFQFTAPYDKRIDYVFVSDHFEVRKYGALTDSKNQRYPSDHIPVVATINLVK